MAKQPFSAPKPRSLPTVTPAQDINEVLANWKTQLNPLVKNAAPQPTPQNFSITNSRGGLTLNWSPVPSASGADGYEILRSLNGSFTDDLQIIPVKNVNQSNFFDSFGGNSATAHYRIRTTSGSATNPQSQRGPESGVVRHTSIDASDTASVPVTVFDTFTTDSTRGNARLGNYGAIKVSPTGNHQAGSGAKGGAGTSAGQPAKSSTSFASLGTGTNKNGILIVGSGAKIVPDANSPGVIDSTQVQGTPVTTDTPVDGGVLRYSAASGTLQYAAIIASGPEASLQSVLPLAQGEIYAATDTGSLFIGTPGIGLGYIQAGNSALMIDMLTKILNELRAIRAASVQVACDGGKALPADFDPQALSSEAEAN